LGVEWRHEASDCDHGCSLVRSPRVRTTRRLSRRVLRGPCGWRRFRSSRRLFRRTRKCASFPRRFQCPGSERSTEIRGWSWPLPWFHLPAAIRSSAGPIRRRSRARAIRRAAYFRFASHALLRPWAEAGLPDFVRSASTEFGSGVAPDAILWPSSEAGFPNFVRTASTELGSGVPPDALSLALWR
jgi:hypothetical protein